MKKKDQKNFTKELEFTNTTFVEVDTNKLQTRSYGTHGKRDKGILTINNLVYSTEKIKSIVAEQGTYMEDIIYLEGNITLDYKNGYKYKTEQAEYDSKHEIINITAPFIATRSNNIIKGDTFTYNIRKKEGYGTIIDATIYTIKK